MRANRWRTDKTNQINKTRQTKKQINKNIITLKKPKIQKENRFYQDKKEKRKKREKEKSIIEYELQST